MLASYGRSARPFADARTAFAFKRSQMLRALLAPFVLFVATTALSGCGLFEFGTLEFLSSDGSTAMGPQDLTTQRADGGTTPQDMGCTPTEVKTFDQRDVSLYSNVSCWEVSSSMTDGFIFKNKNVTFASPPQDCRIRFNPVDTGSNQNYVLEIDYKISGVNASPLSLPLARTPYIMDSPADLNAPYFDFRPNPRSGTHSAKIPFQSTRVRFDLVLGVVYAATDSGKDLIWEISKITLLSTACPK